MHQMLAGIADPFTIAIMHILELSPYVRILHAPDQLDGILPEIRQEDHREILPQCIHHGLVLHLLLLGAVDGIHHVQEIFRAPLLISRLHDESRLPPLSRACTIRGRDGVFLRKARDKRPRIHKIAHVVPIFLGNDIPQYILKCLRRRTHLPARLIPFTDTSDPLAGVFFQIDEVDHPVDLADRRNDFIRPAFRCECLLETPLVSALFPDQIIDRSDPDDDLKVSLILMHADGLQFEVFIPLAVPFGTRTIRERFLLHQMAHQPLGAKIPIEIPAGLFHQQMITEVCDACTIREFFIRRQRLFDIQTVTEYPLLHDLHRICLEVCEIDRRVVQAERL